MDMDFESYYEISRTADFIRSGSFARVALQFPDELLKDSTKVVRCLRNTLQSLNNSNMEESGDSNNVGLFVMADTTFGSCCVDEVGAAHVNAYCIIHYGHACLSPTSMLPAFFVFGKAPINISNCVENLLSHASSGSKPIVVLFGLEYAHAIQRIQEATFGALNSGDSGSELHFSDATTSAVYPSESPGNFDILQSAGQCNADEDSNTPASSSYAIGGLTWNMPPGRKMDECLLFYIGSDNAAFRNVVLTFNGCEIVRYDPAEECLVTDLSQQRRILKRRYFLVEKAKDANIVGILVGTLGVAGYLHMIHQIKELITGSGKKAYTFAMGRPNPAKLANFPECDIFVYVSCAQTALLDSKDFLSPVITPFEAMLAFKSGSQWTGAYVMEFGELINSSPVEVMKPSEEARFSFLQGGYIEDQNLHGTENGEDENEGALALANATEKALQLRDHHSKLSIKGTARSGAEYFAARSYHGLELNGASSVPESFLLGRSGRAAGYANEKAD